MTPGEAIRKFCVQCVVSPHEVKNCGGDKCLNGGCDDKGICWFYRYRLGTGRPSVKLIRKYCLYCQGGSQDLVRECIEGEAHSGIEACSLFPFRMGTNPARKGMGGRNLPQHKAVEQAVCGTERIQILKTDTNTHQRRNKGTDEGQI